MTHDATGARPRRLLLDVALLVGVVLVLGALGAVVWSQVVDLPRVSRSGGHRHVVVADITHQVAVDAWYAVIALVGGLLGGFGVVAWRRTDPLLAVPVVSAAGCLAGWVMRWLGRLLGPDSPTAALHAGARTAPVQLVLHAPGVVWLWPAATAAGCLVWLFLSAPARGDG